MIDLRTKVFTADEEFIFKTLMLNAKKLFEKDIMLTDNGIVIEAICEAGGDLEECVLDLFGVPEDTTMAMMTYKADGDPIYHPDSFCRDAGDDILTNYRCGEYSLDDCYKMFIRYLREDVGDYLHRFPLAPMPK